MIRRMLVENILNFIAAHSAADGTKFIVSFRHFDGYVSCAHRLRHIGALAFHSHCRCSLFSQPIVSHTVLSSNPSSIPSPPFTLLHSLSFSISLEALSYTIHDSYHSYIPSYSSEGSLCEKLSSI